MEQPFSHKTEWIGNIFVPISSPTDYLITQFAPYPYRGHLQKFQAFIHKVKNGRGQDWYDTIATIVPGNRSK
jgi:hypothetical protein